ncbi:MAG: EAL domain-containing protein [Candidatus Korobacteraceae bacterium]
MRTVTELDRDSSTLARHATLISIGLAMAGSGLGIFAITYRAVTGVETAMVLSSGLFGLAAFAALYFRKATVKTLALLSTAYYALFLCSGVMAAVLGNGKHVNLFTYLVWFFPLLVFNKLLNVGPVGRFLDLFLLGAPLALLAALSHRLIAVYPIESLIVVVGYGLSYACFALALKAATRYREAYFMERERAESLRVESEVLESISDCFISVDSENALVYINDAAIAEFGIDPHLALHHKISPVISGFFSESVLAGLRAAATSGSAYEFEAQTEDQQLWYRIRCFPRRERMSIFFRNITEAVLSRRSLEAAAERLREQSELLDKAQDAIFISDNQGCIIYWNKGAERLFGWSAEEAKGRRLVDLFHQHRAEVSAALSSVSDRGEWTCELSKCHKDGRVFVVESRSTLLCGADGSSRSILTINTDITDRKAAGAEIFHLAFYDFLTDLPNRMLLRERIEEALKKSSRHQTACALMLIDLDDFKTLNDTEGHDVGDIVLKDVAQRIVSCVREADTTARLGGDEFVVLLEGLSGDVEMAAAESRLIGDKILRECQQPVHLENHDYEGTTSIGVTVFCGTQNTGDQLLKQADLAMYRAKSKGRNAMCFFDPAMEALVVSRAALLSDLKCALQNGELELHYQPQLNSVGQVTGAEALMRWRHPLRGMVPPNEFIPLAESAGLINGLGYWALETASQQLASWAHRPQMRGLNLAVNVSIRQLQDSGFVPLIGRLICESGVNPQKLKLEITESFMMERAKETIAKMIAIKALGVGFSMDDFGTGYSSLSQLKELPLDQLKIDQSFVRDMLNDEKNASILRTIIALAKSLNLSLIAEGVETPEQREFLLDQGCCCYQGYLFSPALPTSKFELFVEKSRQLTENAVPEYRLMKADLDGLGSCLSPSHSVSRSGI